MEQILFYFYALVACGCAIAVVLSQNVVRMAFWLVLSLASVAGLFFLLDADFVGATQLLIYVGGTVVLLIFGVMLTASGPYVQLKSSPADIMQAGLIGAAFLALVSSTVLAVNWEENEHKIAGHATEVAGYNPEQSGNTSRPIGTALLGLRFDKDLAQPGDAHAEDHSHGDHGHAHGAKTGVSTGYLLPFEIVSVHLLVVLVGAAYLARAKRRNVAVS